MNTIYIYICLLAGHLSLSVHDVNSSQNNEEVLFWYNSTDSKAVWDGEWKLGTVTMPSQSRDHHLVFEAVTCAGRCKSGSIALDDFRLFDGECEDVSYVWPDRKIF